MLEATAVTRIIGVAAAVSHLIDFDGLSSFACFAIPSVAVAAFIASEDLAFASALMLSIARA